MKASDRARSGGPARPRRGGQRPARLGSSLKASLLLGVLLAITGAIVSVIAASKRGSEAARMRAALLGDVDQGDLDALARAQALGRKLIVADPGDREAAAALAFASAALALDYGMDTAQDAQVLLARWRDTPKSSKDDAPGAMAAAARALVSIHAGNREAAEREVARAAEAAPDSPYPLFALGRARSLGGDSPGAARAFEAAIVASPAFSAARVAWAEAQLDLGDARAARLTLRAVLAQSPRDLRAALLLDEAADALDGDEAAPDPAPPGTDAHAGRDTPEPSAICGDTLRGDRPAPTASRWPPAFVRAACALSEAMRARRSGSRAEALVRARAAAAAAPDEPRLLARVALELAQLGAVDRAAAAWARARRVASADTPALAWASVAVSLGRGRAPVLPDGPRPANPETRLLEARASLAAGGLGELTKVLDRLGKAAVARDGDLALLARLPGGGGHDVRDTDENDPVRAYVDGLSAQFRGDLAAAAERLWHALSGHGDACRAVGEYVAALRALRLPADPAAWRTLASDNAGCVNLH